MYLRNTIKAISLTVPLLFLIVGCEAPATRVNSGTATAVGGILKDIQTSVTALQSAQKDLATSQQTANANQTKINQFVSDRLDEARYANIHNTQQNGATTLVESNLAPAAVAINTPPSAAVKDQEVVDLGLALSQAQSDKAILQAKIDTLTANGNQLSGQATLLATQVKAKEDALTVATQATDAQVTELASVSAQVKINAAETAVAQQQTAKEAAAKERLATSRWFMIFGGIFIAIGVGLAFIHVPDTLGVGLSVGGTMLGVGWLISYIEDLLQQAWFRYVLDGSILIGLGAIAWIGYRAWQHRQQVATTAIVASNLVGAIQEAANDDKKTGSTTIAALQPYLQDWHVTSTGSTDTAVMKSINQTATALNLINPGQVSAATGTALQTPTTVPPGISVTALPTAPVVPQTK